MLEIYDVYPKKMHTCVIQITVNHTLALESSLLNTPMCMINLTCLQLDLMNNSRMLGASG